jgi:hypothetical protein
MGLYWVGIWDFDVLHGRGGDLIAGDGQASGMGLRAI